ncbi:hypothetical protein [Streptomyces sp. Tue6028]
MNRLEHRGEAVPGTEVGVGHQALVARERDDPLAADLGEQG